VRACRSFNDAWCRRRNPQPAASHREELFGKA
jgi:hypothetical protein